MNTEREPTATELKVYEMITENTGQQFLDSGGTYGRHWERNQKHSIFDFINADKVVLHARYYSPTNSDLYGIKSLFHHLVDNLKYDKHMDTLFQRFVNQNEKAFWEYWDEDWKFSHYNPEIQQMEHTYGPHGYGNFSWDKAIESFVELAKNQHRGRNFEWAGYDFNGEEFSGYTYNDENCLSQDFVYDVFGEYAFIRTHNGCDARGGFSYPVLFKLSGNNEYGLLEYDRYTISCKEGHWWDYQGGYEETEQEIKLKDCEAFDMDDPELADKYAADMKEYLVHKAWFEKQDALPGIEKGTIVMPQLNTYGKVGFKDGKAYCPVCGQELYADYC